MAQSITAIFHNGTLKPLHPLEGIPEDSVKHFVLAAASARTYTQKQIG